MDATYNGYHLKVNGEMLFGDDYAIRALISHVDVNAGVKIIRFYAFEGCTALSSIALPPEGLHEIGDWAFYGCTALCSVVLPEGLNAVGAAAFKGFIALFSIVLPDGLNEIGAFRQFAAGERGDCAIALSVQGSSDLPPAPFLIVLS